MTKDRKVKISCIGISFIQPIFDLYTKLKSIRFGKHNGTQVSSIENGYSVSIIVLSVLLIESVLNRVRYLERSNEKNLKFFKLKFNEEELLLTKLYEIYVLRDLIVHNHIWRISHKFDQDYNEVDIYQTLLSGYGDNKYKDYVNKRKKCTKNLKLNINPIKVNTTDVNKVLVVAKELFYFLEQQNNAYFPLSNFYFEYDNKEMTFYKIINDIISS